MILSLSQNFIFVHIPKTAGSSMTKALQPFSRDYTRTLASSLKRRIPYRENPDSVHFRVHETAAKMIQKLGRDTFDGFTTFSVVRHPYTHAVSHYEYMKQFRIASSAKKVGAMSFEEYLLNRKKRPFWNDTIFVRMPDQTYYLVDKNDEIAVDRLIRFENLVEDFQMLAQDLKLEGASIEHVNKTKAKKKPIESYFTGPCEDLVLEIYDRDFDNFGYERRLPA